MTIFQKKGRPQGNGDKTDLRLFFKKHYFSKKGRPQGNINKKDNRFFLNIFEIWNSNFEDAKNNSQKQHSNPEIRTPEIIRPEK